MQRPITLVLVAVLMSVPGHPNPQAKEHVATENSEPPSISLPHPDTLGEGSGLPGLAQIVVGQSNYDKQQEVIKAEAEAAAIAAAQEAERKRQEAARLESARAADKARIAAEKKQREESTDSRPSSTRVLAQEPLSDIKQIARSMIVATWDESQWSYFDELVKRESGWNPQAKNRSSGACGLPQALPCSKLPNGINTSAEGQIQWMINYVKSRYGSPQKAISFHNSHNWY